MELRPDQIDAQLKQGLAPLYLLYGEETLLLQEAADAIRAAARAAGYLEREVFHAEAGFDWNQIQDAANALSLFADRRILEVRLPGGKPGDAGSKTLIGYADRPAEDTLLLVICGKLEPAQRKSKWFKTLAEVGAVVAAWPVDIRQLPRWIEQRLRREGLQASPDAIQLLADRVEGNLLAAAQEIAKLSLLYPGATLDIDAVAEVVADSARFDVFGLVDAALLGETGRCVRMLQGLKQEGVEPVLVAWALTREVRNLEAMAWEMAQGQALGGVMGRFRVWKNRQNAVGQALQRHRLPVWRALVRDCARIDRVIKGQAPGNPWDELVQLCLGLSGQRLGLAG